MALILRNEIPYDTFDYLELTSVLSRYANIRGKIHRLLAGGEIIRIKKGLYTFPAGSRRYPLNPVLLANRVYGPSYVSGDYALSYYGLIPERVEEVTSVTVGRSRLFRTPVGRFSYALRFGHDYPIGVNLLETPEGNAFIAAPEKALYDKAADDPRFDGGGIPSYLWDDLRIDRDQVSRFSADLLAELMTCARGRMKKLVNYLVEVVSEQRR